MDEDTAARIAAELAALKLELAGVRASTAADHSSVPAGETADDRGGWGDGGRGGGGTRGRGFGARVGFRRLGGAGEVARRVVPFG